MRKMGDILLDLEAILDELVDSQDLQFGDILNLVHGHLIIHRPDAQEQYVSGGSPIFNYKPAPNRKDTKKRITRLLKKWENSKLDSGLSEKILTIIEKEYK